MFFLLLIICIAIIVVVYKKSQENNNDSGAGSKPESSKSDRYEYNHDKKTGTSTGTSLNSGGTIKKEDLEDTPSRIRLSKGFETISKAQSVAKKDQNHTITPILKYESATQDIWICPTCETENSINRTNCCVCNSSKE